MEKAPHGRGGAAIGAAGGRRSRRGRRIRRAWRHMRRLIRPCAAQFVYSDLYQFGLPGGMHDPLRGERILGFLAEEGLLAPRALHRPRVASFEQLCRVHAVAYLEALDQAGGLAPVFGLSLPAQQEERLLEVQRTMVGGTVLASRLALPCRGVAVNLGGGLHHAHAGHGRGFCAFNDVAVAIASLRAHGFSGRILVIDLDLHDGDGTRALFAEDPEVHTYSIHNQAWGPTEGVATTAIELGSAVGDERFLEVLRETLPPVVTGFRPNFVFYLAGTDPAGDDALGNWELSAQGILERDQLVFELVRGPHLPPPLVILLSGGYGEETWRYSARFLGWLASRGTTLEPPTTEEITLGRYHALSRSFTPRELQGEGGEDDWGLSADDLLPALGGFGGPARFLGYYSQAGIELALERYGFLARLRALGFEEPHLELDLGNPSGETLRLWSGPEKKELLVELRVRRDRRTLPEYELLFVEWLLLQNPRARFTRDHPMLPGQKWPGLGVLKEITAMLVMVCERLHLDGLAFMPAHFHLAAQSRKFLRFLEPQDEARFRAFAQALDGCSLPLASRAAAAGHVVDAVSGASVRWQPAPMVLPVSQSLKDRVATEEYEAAVDAALRNLDFTLLGPSAN